MTIRKKLLVTISVINILTLIIGIVSLLQLHKINETYKELLQSHVADITLIGDLRKNAATQSTSIRNYILDPSMENADTMTKQSQSLTDSLTNLTKKITENSNGKTDDDLVKQLELAGRSENQVQQYLTSIVSLTNAGKKQEAYKMANGRINDASQQLLMSLESIKAEKQSELEKTTTAADNRAATSNFVVIGIVLFTFAIGVFTIVYLSRQIAGPTRNITNEVERLANGDLTGNPIETSKRAGELFELSNEFNKMKQSLYDIIKTSNDSSLTLSGSSEELLSSLDEVNILSERIAERIRQATKTMETNKLASSEIAEATSESAIGISKIAEETTELQNHATHTKTLANAGNETLDLATTQMEHIQSSTQKIHDLMQVLTKKSSDIHTFSAAINGIAEQTNLLALNAAIEAARAGESGKGFAVVADEVRKLSEQSKHAADQIVSLTKDIMNETVSVQQAVDNGLLTVSEGVTTIQQASDAFHSIQQAVIDMTDQVATISAVTEQISASSEQVAATAEQAARASDTTLLEMVTVNEAVSDQVSTFSSLNDVAKDLTTQAEHLQSHIQNFKL